MWRWIAPRLHKRSESSTSELRRRAAYAMHIHFPTAASCRLGKSRMAEPQRNRRGTSENHPHGRHRGGELPHGEPSPGAEPGLSTPKSLAERVVDGPTDSSRCVHAQSTVELEPRKSERAVAAGESKCAVPAGEPECPVAARQPGRAVTTREAHGREARRGAVGPLRLKAQGFDPGDADGVYGPNTRAATSNYQRSNGLQETGRFDRATLAKLGVGSTSR